MVHQDSDNEMLSKECSAACRRSEEEGVPWGPSVPVVLLHRVCFFSHEQMMLWWSTSSAHKVEALEPETLEGQRYLTGIDSAWARCHLSNEDVLFGEMISSKSANLNRNVGSKSQTLDNCHGFIYWERERERLVLLEYQKIWDEMSYHKDFKC